MPEICHSVFINKQVIQVRNGVLYCFVIGIKGKTRQLLPGTESNSRLRTLVNASFSVDFFL